MKEFLAQLREIPTKLLKAINGFIDGISLQIATAKGSVIFLIALVLIVDVASRGDVGVLGFLLEQLKAFTELFITMVKEGGWQLVIGALILLAFLTPKK